ncbi:MAG: hypothetical protein Q4F77_09650 [Acinetobacter sp.]|uniref:hypothetical protein n=1 Tax=Acinetobacter sp. TaxID=472 RepID=UPI0026E001C1|nr:hypothetical protein [Acinetobacter sp.]MDO5543557.1 hypothetical protein [Acinetobacter sp.]
MKLTQILLASTFAFATVTTFAAKAESTATEQEKVVVSTQETVAEPASEQAAAQPASEASTETPAASTQQP